jgi:methionyl aminopeptidase
MIPIKTDDEIRLMREACQAAATVLHRVCEAVKPGVSTFELDQLGKVIMDEIGCESACYNYRVGSKRFPGYTCLSVNEEIVHGIGDMNRILKDGDCITVDIVTRYKGFIGDNARSIIVGGKSSPEVEKLVKATEDALMYALNYAKPGKRIGDISNAVQRYVNKFSFGIVKDFVGHGVGRSMHEDPQIPNYGDKRSGPKIRPGMTLAIEPMVTLKSPETKILEDGWTAVTKDKSCAAHFEHTVLIGVHGAEILTIPKI